MKEVEARAKTRQEAIKKALDELGAELHEVEIEIVDEGSKGLFGLGSREVHVKVRAEDIPDEKPAEDGDRNREREGRRGGRNRGGRGGENRGARDGGNRGKNEEKRGDRKPRGKRDGGEERPRRDKGGDRKPRENREDKSESAKPVVAATSQNSSSNDGDGEQQKPRRRGQRRRGGRGRGRSRAAQGSQNEGQQNESNDQNRQSSRGDGPRRSESANGQSRRPRRDRPRSDERPRREPRPKRERTEPIDKEKADALAKSGAITLKEIIEKMDLPCEVTGEVTDDGDILLHVDSEDSAILIGRKGSTLQSLQFIMNRILLKGEDPGAPDRVVVDVERYRQRRRESLEEMAVELAAKAKESGRTMRVKPLNPQERRIVHLALEGDEDIRTYSLGSSALRRIVIVPKDAEDGGEWDEADEEHETADSDSES